MFLLWEMPCSLQYNGTNPSLHPVPFFPSPTNTTNTNHAFHFIRFRLYTKNSCSTFWAFSSAFSLISPSLCSTGNCARLLHEALCCRLEGPRVDSRWVHRIFHVTCVWLFKHHYCPVFYSVPGIFLGGEERPVPKADSLTAIYMPIV
jgi:hypothetical protein